MKKKTYTIYDFLKQCASREFAISPATEEKLFHSALKTHLNKQTEKQ